MRKFRIYWYPKNDPLCIRYGNLTKDVKNPDGSWLSDSWKKECDKYNAPQSPHFYGVEVEEVKPRAKQAEGIATEGKRR